MNHQGQRNKNFNTNKAVDVKYHKKGQQLDGTCLTNDSKTDLKSQSSSKQTCKESFGKSHPVAKSFDQEPTVEHNKNTNHSPSNKHIQLANTNRKDSSINLSTPGLCSALQLANEIQLVSMEVEKPKQYNIHLERNDKHKTNVVRKANIPFTKQIFRNLVDLNINDDSLVSGKSVKTKNASYDRKCDSTFILSNFYKPSFSMQCCAQIVNQKVDIEKVQFYNGVDLYNHTELFNSL